MIEYEEAAGFLNHFGEHLENETSFSKVRGLAVHAEQSIGALEEQEHISEKYADTIFESIVRKVIQHTVKLGHEDADIQKQLTSPIHPSFKRMNQTQSTWNTPYWMVTPWLLSMPFFAKSWINP